MVYSFLLCMLSFVMNSFKLSKIAKNAADSAHGELTIFSSFIRPFLLCFSTFFLQPLLDVYREAPQPPSPAGFWGFVEVGLPSKN